MTTQTTTPAFETEECSRCGGTGEYSYCPRFGRKCFKCLGHRRVYTKRGLAAREFLRSLRQRPVSQLKPGDTIKAFAGWAVVKSVTVEESRGASSVGGVMTPYVRDTYTVDADRAGVRVSVHGLSLDATFEVLFSEEDQARQVAEALAYQETLTKSGTPRKRTAK